MTGILVQLSVSDGGMPKLPVMFARVTRNGVEGDRQRNLRYHGGPDRTVCLYSEELYAALRADGISLGSGAVGENVTTRGIDLQTLRVADRLKVGECVIEITEVRIPCRNLNKLHPDLLKAIKGRSGWVAKVLVEATVRPGDPVDIVAGESAHDRVI